MKAVVLSGGEGTRLRPLTCTRPKPMVKVAGSPMLLHAVNLLKSHGLTDLHLTLHYMPDTVKEYLGDGSSFGVNVAYSVEEYPLGTAGGVKKIQNELDEPFLVTSGDVLTDIDLSRIISFHKSKGAAATIAVKRVKDPLQFGIVLTDDEGRVRKFLEKPSWGQVVSDTINIGIYVLEPEILHQIPPGREFDFSKNLFPLLLENNEPIFACPTEGYWTDIGTLEQYLQANRDILEGKLHLSMAGRQREPGVWTGENADVSRDAEITPPVFIGNDVIIGRGVKLGEFSTLCDGVTAEAEAVVKRSVVLDRSFIGAGAQLIRCIVGERCRIGGGASIYDFSTLGDDCAIGGNSTIKQGVRIWPSKSIEPGSVVTSDIRWGVRWTKDLFGPWGMLGQANIQMTPELTAKLGAAIGTYLGRNAKLVVARDTRRSSRMIKRAVTAGLASAGVDAYNLKVTPSPVAQFFAVHSKLDGGLYIKVPQNDPRTISLEVYDSHGINIGKSAEKKIQDILEKEDIRRVPFDHVGALIYPADYEVGYLHGLAEFIERESIRKRRPKVVVDCSNGSGSLIIPRILADLGCEVVTVNATLAESADSEPPNGPQSALLGVINLLKRLRADVGLLFESSGSRVVFIDEGGSVVSGDRSLAGLAKRFVERNGGGNVVVPVTASQAVDVVVEKVGGRVTRCGLGANRLQEAVLKENAIFAGDEGRAYICPQFHIGCDGIVAAAKLMEFMCEGGQKASDVFAGVPTEAKVYETISCPWQHKGFIMRTLFEEFGDKRIDMLEGLKIYEEDSWVAIVPCSEEPVIRLYAEARTQDRARAVLAAYASKIRELIPTA